MHRQAAIVAFLQTEELDLNKSNQQLHGASSVSDEQGLPSELRPGVETVRVVEPLFALVDPRLQPHTPLIREESVYAEPPRSGGSDAFGGAERVAVYPCCPLSI